MKPFVPLAALALLVACGSVTPAGLVAASRLDPLATPPGDIALAVAVPAALRLRDGDATLRLAFRPDGAEAPAVDETIRLALSPPVSGGPEVGPGTRVVVARIPPADRPRLSAAQAAVRALRDDDVEGSGSLTVAVTGGCLEATLGDALPVSTWIRTAPDAPFVRLTRARDAFADLPAAAAAALRGRLAPCPD